MILTAPTSFTDVGRGTTGQSDYAMSCVWCEEVIVLISVGLYDKDLRYAHSLNGECVFMQLVYLQLDYRNNSDKKVSKVSFENLTRSIDILPMHGILTVSAKRLGNSVGRVFDF